MNIFNERKERGSLRVVNPINQSPVLEANDHMHGGFLSDVLRNSNAHEGKDKVVLGAKTPGLLFNQDGDNSAGNKSK
jgi:hypothetical protein